MAITDKEKGVWSLDQVYNKLNQGSIISYDGISEYWQWGGAEYGSFGINESGSSPSTRKRKSSPVQLPGTTWQTEFYNAPGQGWHSVLAKTDGTLWAFGKGQDWGQLGQNSKVDYSSPVQIGSRTDWKLGGTIREGSFAIRTDGTLWTWGSNGYGFGGKNDRTTRSSPAHVPGTTWNYAWGGHESLFAIKTDGTLWGWGRNGGGELGLNQGPGNERSSPVQITTATNWVRGSSSAEYGANGAINSDGELWVWGYNQNGELGQNSHQTPAYRGISSPTQIPGTNWQYFQSCGSGGSIGKKTDGTLWVWGGQNISSGATGDATVAGKRSSPVQVPGTNWDRISGGSGHVVATKTDGTLWLWGSNGNGRLGQNDLTSRSSPIQVPGTSWVNVNVGGESQSTIATKIV